jgi:fatty acid desaturase
MRLLREKLAREEKAREELEQLRRRLEEEMESERYIRLCPVCLCSWQLVLSCYLRGLAGAT